MKIENINGVVKKRMEDLELMRLALCYDEEQDNHFFLIKRSDGDYIYLQNYDNDEKGVCILNGSDPEKVILFCGYVENMIIKIEGLRK